MDYPQLVRDAWALTWHYKWLWLLGFFSGGAAGTCGGSTGSLQRPTTGGNGRFNSDNDFDWRAVTDWMQDHIGLLLILAGIALLLLAVCIVVNCIASGAIARATSELAQGREITLGAAWRAGLQLFPRYFGLILLSAAVGLALVAIYGLVYVAAGWRGFALVGALSLIVTVPLGIVLIYSQCSIAVRDLGTIDAVAAAIQLFRAQLGSSLLAWLMLLVVGALAGFALVVALLVAAIVLAIPAIVLGVTLGVGAFVAYAVIGGTIACAVLLVLIAAYATFAWAYWMLAYLRLSPQAAEAR